MDRADRVDRSSPAIATTSLRAVLFAAMALVATFLVYAPVRSCFFHDDDFVHLYRGVNAPWHELVGQQWGGHMIAVFTVVVAGMLKVFGPRAGVFYSTMLLTHLVAVALLFVLVMRLTRNPHAAGVASLLWGTTPLHTETLGWFSVYGQVLATIAMVAAILVTLSHTGTGRSGATLALIPGLLVPGALAYGVGIAVALVFPLVVWLLLPPGRSRRQAIAAAAVGVLAIPVIYHLTSPGGGLPAMANAYLPHARALVVALVTNTSRLLAHGVTRLHLGALGAAPALPPGVLLAMSALWAVLIGTGYVRASTAGRRQMAALALLALAIYVTVAFGRSIFALADMGAVRRYHYAATLPLAALTGLALGGAFHRMRATLLDGALAAMCIAAIGSRGITGTSIPQFSAGRAEAARVIAAVEQAAASVPPGGMVRIPNQRFGPAGPVIAGGFPGWAAVFAIWSPSNVVDGRRVVFVESDPVVVAAAANGRRSASLLVGPGEAAEAGR
jgi:hypothetical protein